MISLFLFFYLLLVKRLNLYRIRDYFICIVDCKSFLWDMIIEAEAAEAVTNKYEFKPIKQKLF